MTTRALRGQLLRFAPSVLGAPLLLLASQLDGDGADAHVGRRAAGRLPRHAPRGRVGVAATSAGHFAERHGLIIIVALGESIVAIGVGVAQLPISWPIVVASVLGLTLAAALWWAYFDVRPIVAERALAVRRARQRAAWPATRTATCTCR